MTSASRKKAVSATSTEKNCFQPLKTLYEEVKRAYPLFDLRHASIKHLICLSLPYKSSIIFLLRTSPLSNINIVGVYRQYNNWKQVPFQEIFTFPNHLLSEHPSQSKATTSPGFEPVLCSLSALWRRGWRTAYPSRTVWITCTSLSGYERFHCGRD